jgi:hypothetical protein
VASTPLGRNERWYTVSLFESNRLKEWAMWHVNPLLGNGLLKHARFRSYDRRGFLGKIYRIVSVKTARQRLFTQQRKSRFYENRRNEELYHCTECFISCRHEASLGRENWAEEEHRSEEIRDWGVLPSSRSPVRERDRREDIQYAHAHRIHTRSI